MQLIVCHLYPDLMNIYGDRGNIIALSYRANLQGIDLEVGAVTVDGVIDPEKYDLYFFGGGQDRQQNIVAEDLPSKKEALVSAINNGAALLSICGGFQLLGKYYKDQDGAILPGIGLFDCYTEAGKKRMIGNVVAETEMTGKKIKVVGFENHSGRTFLGKEQKALAKIVRGFGNNGEDKTEGIVYKNAIGTYLHGSFLPKNPEITDWLLEKAIQRKNPDFKLPPLDDEFEQMAKTAAIKRAGEVKQVSL